MIINSFIKQLVDANQVCIDDLADLSGMSVQKIDDIVNERKVATPMEAHILLKVLGYELEDILRAY